MSIAGYDRSGLPPQTQQGKDQGNELAAGLGKHHAKGQMPGDGAAEAARLARFDAAMASARTSETAPVKALRRTEDDTPEDPDALPFAPPAPLALIVPGGTPPAPPPPSAQRDRVIEAITERVGVELRAAIEARPGLRGEGFTMRMDLGSTMLGVQSITLKITGETMVLQLALMPGGGAHDLPMAVQGLALMLAARHPGRTIRIEEETRRSGETESEGFSPFAPPVSLRP